MPIYRELCITESICEQVLICADTRNSYLARQAEKTESIVRDACSRTPYQRAGIYRLRTVVRPQADGGGRLRTRPGARRNLRVSRAALLRALLFRAEGRERQD